MQRTRLSINFHRIREDINRLTNSGDDGAGFVEFSKSPEAEARAQVMIRDHFT
jgi:hypothetical protein